MYDIGIKLSKLVNTPLKVGFPKIEVVNLLCSLQIIKMRSYCFFQLQK